MSLSIVKQKRIFKKWPSELQYIDIKKQ